MHMQGCQIQGPAIKGSYIGFSPSIFDHEKPCRLAGAGSWAHGIEVKNLVSTDIMMAAKWPVLCSRVRCSKRAPSGSTALMPQPRSMTCYSRQHHVQQRLLFNAHVSYAYIHKLSLGRNSCYQCSQCSSTKCIPALPLCGTA